MRIKYSIIENIISAIFMHYINICNSMYRYINVHEHTFTLALVSMTENIVIAVYAKVKRMLCLCRCKTMLSFRHISIFLGSIIRARFSS